MMDMRRHRLWLYATVLVLVGMTSGVAAQEKRFAFSYERWLDEVSRRGLDPAHVVYPFEASPEMVSWAERVVGETRGSGAREQLGRLQRAMFEGDSFDFAYDDTRTLTARDAFTARRGNCMSFTALFVALSRSAGIQTFLIEARRDPEVGREDGLVIISRHVVAAYRSGGQVSVYDFYLSSGGPFVNGLVVDDVRASAMYHANLGGAALREDDLEEALRNLEITTVLAPDWTVGWVNLGVTLAHLGDVEGAFSCYRRALEIDLGNSSALNNLSYLYLSLGREAEARVALRAAAQETESPFTLVAMADSEMQLGNHSEAVGYLKKARRRYPREPEVYMGMARFARKMEKPDRARRFIRKAEKLSRIHDGPG
jgi:Flp pilus assembly protein TadD